jgi:hypothetical protein
MARLDLIAQIRDHLAERTNPKFDMTSCSRCIFHDVYVVCNEGQLLSDPDIGKVLQLTDKEVQEIFYAGDVSLNNKSKEEALKVLDAIVRGEPIIGVWARECPSQPEQD